jgi:hypothetical protein
MKCQHLLAVSDNPVFSSGKSHEATVLAVNELEEDAWQLQNDLIVTFEDWYSANIWYSAIPFVVYFILAAPNLFPSQPYL